MPVRAQEVTTPAGLTPPQAPEVFATSGVPAARRVELWESHNATALIGLDVRTVRPLEATEVNLQLPQVRLARVSGSAHAVERTAAVIGRSPADSVAAYLTLRGDARFTCQGGRYALRPGDALVCETDQPFAREFPRGLTELVVTIPRAALAVRCDITRLRAPVTVSFGAPVSDGPGDDGAAAGRYARALARIASRATRTEAPLSPDERTVLDLVAVLAGGPHAARATAHLAAALCYIEEHLTDPNLGANEIAAAAGLSERQLSRVFAADGTSVPRHILSRRLQLAYAVLAAGPPGRTAPARHSASETSASETSAAEDGGAKNNAAGRGAAARDAGAGEARVRETGETVAEVAARCGFTSTAYFSNMFRKRFGVRAGDLRRGAALPQEGSSAAMREGSQRRRPA